MSIPPFHAQIAEFPRVVIGLNKMSETALQVLLDDGTETRLMAHPKREFVVPRRWRKPRKSYVVSSTL